MTLANDGDVIRGLGVIALYTAYLEEAVDDCVDVLFAADLAPDDRIYRRPTSEKVRYCRRQIEQLAPLPAHGEIQTLMIGCPSPKHAIS